MNLRAEWEHAVGESDECRTFSEWLADQPITAEPTGKTTEGGSPIYRLSRPAYLRYQGRTPRHSYVCVVTAFAPMVGYTPPSGPQTEWDHCDDLMGDGGCESAPTIIAQGPDGVFYNPSFIEGPAVDSWHAAGLDNPRSREEARRIRAGGVRGSHVAGH